MLRNVLTPLLVLLVLTALAGGAVRMWAGDPIPPDLPTLSTRDPAEAPEVPGHEFQWLRHGYLKKIGATFGGEDHPHPESYRLATRRGPTTEHGWPLTVDFTWTGQGVARVEVFVTAERSEKDLAAWEQSAPLELRQTEGGLVAQVRELMVPIDARRYAVRVTYTDGTQWHVGSSVPQAPTALGRWADRLATWPIFRWLPDLR